MFPGQHGDRRGSLPASALSGGRCLSERYPPVGRVDIPSTGQGYRPARSSQIGARAAAASQRSRITWTSITENREIKKPRPSNRRVAISVYVLVAIAKKRLGVEASLYTILQILSLTLFEKIPLDQLFNDTALENFDGENPTQLNLFS
jgi:hypothetical protein